ncbi:hypothetical protein E4L95_13835 [Paracoccus liaowanqingii]|uniref:DUF423 domain-containing protein n=1 Tax=Paracoccus liaowanqingii TaxID=2560053 RepID=A0A4Z1BJC1_9RHOB|nr:DUF6640 family protein [Paracoccus liaowanqingii]TGN56724.1 hypothetical protein E4L95_13835 [Paracoccus liaowanqingii]
MPLASSLLFSFVAIATALAAHLADYSDTHLFNSAWSGHAKYHAAHTMALSALLGALTLFFSWRPGGDALTNLLAAAGFAGVYWVTQAGAIHYPNTLYFDPEFDLPKNYILGLPAQAMFQIVFLSLTGIGVILGLRTILATGVRTA